MNSCRNEIKKVVRCTGVVVLLGSCYEAAAHGGAEPPRDGLSATAGVAVSQRSATAATAIPGLLNALEPHRVEKGISLDDASVSMNYRLKSGNQLVAEYGSHADEEFAIEQFYASLVVLPSLTLDIGRRLPALSPQNGLHASESLFSESTLIWSLLWKGHYADDGIGFNWRVGNGVSLGADVWRGRYPGTSGSGGGVQDLHIAYRFMNETWNLTSRVWWLRADALDWRAADNQHTHASSSSTASDSALQFTGKTDVTGLNLTIHRELSRHWSISFEGELQRWQLRAALFDSTRLVDWQHHVYGVSLQPWLSWRQQDMGLRYERLQLENTLTGAAAQALAEVGGLINNGFDPEVLSLVYRWRVTPEWAVRAEWARDETLPSSPDRAALGVTWRASLR